MIFFVSVYSNTEEDEQHYRDDMISNLYFDSNIDKYGQPYRYDMISNLSIDSNIEEDEQHYGDDAMDEEVGVDQVNLDIERLQPKRCWLYSSCL